MRKAFYSPREKITHVPKIAVVGANFSQPNNGGAIFSQAVIMNKSPRGVFFMLTSMKKSPSFARGNFFTGAKMSSHTGLYP